jgi:hypothetical protein
VTETAWGVLLGVLIQAPLTWLTLRSIGTERFQLIWVSGMLIRLAALGLAGLILVPAFDWRMGPTLGALLGTLLALLLVEVVAAARAHSGINGR